MKKFKGMSPATVKRLIKLVQEPKIKWTKNIMYQDHASYGDKSITIWYCLELEDGRAGYAGLAAGECVTKKFKTKTAAKKAAERWLKGKK